MSHAKAKLTPLGRLLLVERVFLLGWSPAQTAESAGVSRATVYKWLRRYRTEGVAGLRDRTSRPHRLARALPESRVAEVLSERKRLRLGLAPSTTYGILFGATDGLGSPISTARRGR